MGGQRTYDIDVWDLGAEVARMRGTGLKSRTIAKCLMPQVEAACRKLNTPVPNLNALTVKIERYTATDPGDRRTKQARAQGAVVKVAEEQATKIVQAQFDAAQTLQRYVERIDMEVGRLALMVELDPKTHQPVAPDFGKYYTALSGMSKEMRGWIGLLMEIKDRLWQHQQYEDAFTVILAAVKAECPPAVQQAISARLKLDSKVAAALRGMGGGS